MQYNKPKIRVDYNKINQKVLNKIRSLTKIQKSVESIKPDKIKLYQPMGSIENEGLVTSNTCLEGNDNIYCINKLEIYYSFTKSDRQLYIFYKSQKLPSHQPKYHCHNYFMLIKTSTVLELQVFCSILCMGIIYSLRCISNKYIGWFKSEIWKSIQY